MNIDDWKIVKNKSDKHPEFGEPMGEILFRTLEEAEESYKNSTKYFMTEMTQDEFTERKLGSEVVDYEFNKIKRE